MNPRIVMRLPMTSARLRGAAGGSVELYCAMAPHIAMRPWVFIDEMAASRWSPPTLSK